MSRATELTDEQVVSRVLAGEPALFELLMRRHNRRVYRVARAVLRDDAEAEDVMQDAYVRAFAGLARFEGRAAFATWLSRIALHEALARARRRGRIVEIDALEEGAWEGMMEADRGGRPSPEEQARGREARELLEAEISALPDAYRLVVVLRDVEGLDTKETADVLGLTPQAVKTRLHRAHLMLRSALTRRIGASARDAFAFDATRCDRVVTAVLGRLAAG